MKQAENNEMELLIRNLARQEGGSLTDGMTGDGSERHLDTDELNSYAEGALPASTRSRYTAHLADCSRCRRIVSQLVSSSGVSIPGQTVDAEATSGFWERLRVWLSPAVLRYAVPAFILFAVTAIGVLVLRERPMGELASQKSSSTQANDLAPQPTPSGDLSEASDRSATPAKTEPNVQKEKPAADRENSKVSQEEKAKETTTTKEQNKTTSADTAAATSQPTFAPEPAAAPAPKPEPTRGETEAAAARKASDEKREQPREREDDRAKNQTEEQKAAKLKDAQVQGLSGMRTGALRRADAKKPDDDESSIRTVSGKRFRRQGSVWIDTAYQTSSAVTVVARGSEQYRALIADEPGIRTIAEQLSGEVVLVWKGRAYRIR